MIIVPVTLASVSDLFIDLYKYRQRERKHNLEDWLTECVAAVFRTFDRDQWASFINQFLGLNQGCAGAMLANALPDVHTQVHAGAAYGIPDLVVYLTGKPWLLFENKVAHSVSEENSDEGASRNQLHRYAQWLAGNADPKATPHLIFLTHITRPPNDFGIHGEDDAYHNVSRKIATWGALGRMLNSITATEGSRSLSHGLTTAFYEMLKDKNMANEFPTSTAIASLEVFLAQGNEIENLLDRMWSEVAFVANCSNRDREKTEPEFEYGRYSVWRYANRIERVGTKSAFLMTGLWFPEVADTWEADELGGHSPWGPQVFLNFADDNDEVFSGIPGEPSAGWFRPYGDFLRLKPLYEFTGDPDERASKIVKWLAEEAQKLRQFLVREKLTN